jgi:hypothetical protein
MKGSQGFKDATTDRDQIIAWWTKWPDANIGIRTGEASNLVVIDVDAKPGKHGAATLAALEEESGSLPETATVLTSGHGRHYYFTHAFMASTGVGALGLNIDVQSDGRYVVAPPSVHPDGTVYEWADEETPQAELPVGWSRSSSRRRWRKRRRGPTSLGEILLLGTLPPPSIALGPPLPTEPVPTPWVFQSMSGFHVSSPDMDLTRGHQLRRSWAEVGTCFTSASIVAT